MIVNRLELLKLGYTPENFTHILWERGLKREEVAEFLGDSLRTVHRWAVEAERESHADMPLAKWRRFLMWAETKPILRHLPPPDATNKVAAYFNADLQSTTLKAIIDEIPLQYRSDISEYIEDGVEQAVLISEQKWAEIFITPEFTRFRSALTSLSYKATKQYQLERIHWFDPESYTLSKAVAQNPNAGDELRSKCLAILRDSEIIPSRRDQTDYELIWGAV